MHQIAFVVLMLLAPPFSQEQSPKAPARGSISGQVVRADTGEPLKSVRLQLVGNSPDHKFHSYKALSDAEGRFSLNGIVPGRYTFFATRNGFVMQEFKAPGAVSSGSTLAITSNQKLEKLLFRLTPAAVMTGKITDEDGQPVAGVEVQALQEDREDWDDTDPESELTTNSRRQLISVGMALTNDLGEYRIYGLPPGDYYILAVDPDNAAVNEASFAHGIPLQTELNPERPPTYYPGVVSRSEAQSIHMAPAGSMRIDFNLRPIKTITLLGRVLRPDGRPAADINVIVFPRDLELKFSVVQLGSSTDNKGRFSIAGIVPGSYELQASTAIRDQHIFAKQSVEIAGRPPEEIILRLEPEQKISGRLLVPETAAAKQLELSRLLIGLEPTDGDLYDSGTAQIKADGSFEVTNLRKTEYLVDIQGLPPAWYLKSATLGPTDVLVHGISAGSSGSLDLTLSSKAAELSGSVMTDGKPVPGALVRILPERKQSFRRGMQRRALSDQNGHFTIDSITPGAYRVYASVSSASEALERGVAAPSNRSATEHIELAEGEKKTVALTFDEKQQ
jgi:protocatechuate 3,4-dioxygenase beta subunit